MGQAQIGKEKNRDSDEGKQDMKLLGQVQTCEEKKGSSNEENHFCNYWARPKLVRLVLLNLKLLLKGMGFWLHLLIVMVSQNLRIHVSKFDYDLGPSSIGTLGMGMGSTDLKVQRITSPSHGKKVLLSPNTVVSLENITGRLEEFQNVGHWVDLTGQAQSCEPVYFGILLPPTFGKWQ